MGISFFILDAGNCFRAVVIYSFPNEMQVTELTKEMAAIFQTEALLQQPYKRTHIFWSFPESILVPPELINPDNNNDMLNLVFGDANKGVLKSDFLYKHNLQNIYRVPEPIHDGLSAQFAYANQSHEYSLLVDRKMNFGNEMFAIFYTNNVTIMLSKAGKLQVIQNFIYNNPEDAAYHLLNICKSFEVFPDMVNLHISGLVDENSNLYTTVYKYFLNTRFDVLPDNFEYPDEIKDHPTHFFSHLFALAACV